MIDFFGRGMYRYFILLLLIFNSNTSFSQNFANGDETDFAWHIKQIDEFIERFNNKDETLIKLYTKKNNPSPELTRERLLISLFNAESKNWNVNDIKSFINEINYKKKPIYLNFFDKGWCAKLICLVTWNGKPENVLLTLRIEKSPDESSKWVIAGVNADFLKRQRVYDSITNRKISIIPFAKNHTTSLHPFSHATTFMNIDQVSKDKENIENYFVKPINSSGSEDLLTFINEIINNRLLINQPISLTYNFYQVKGWTFEVSEYNRQSRNSGWLISKLTRLPLKRNKQYENLKRLKTTYLK